ncbi:hypothetical protein D3C87_1821340 [compost metagenome]
MASHAFLCPCRKVSQPIEGCPCFLEKGLIEQLDKIVVICGNEREAEIGLAVEMMIETALRHAGGLEDFVDADRGIALLGEVLEPGSYEILPSCRFLRCQARATTLGLLTLGE